MNMPTMEEIREEVLAVASTPGWSVNRLAIESGAEQASLSRFCRGPEVQKTLSWVTLEKIRPFLYGDKRPLPSPAHTQDGAA